MQRSQKRGLQRDAGREVSYAVSLNSIALMFLDDSARSPPLGREGMWGRDKASGGRIIWSICVCSLT